jgi:acyl-CoA synthetase (AMP-forming)/AMP-acid ligase II/thioesterase domain-containing protein
MPRTVRELVAAGARVTPGAVALAAPGRPPLSYAGLLEQIDATVARLGEAGLGRGDRVAVVLPNGPEMAAAFLGVASAAACAPLNPTYREAELDFYLSDLGARALVLDPALESPARAVAEARGIAVLELERIDGEAGRFRLAGPAAGDAAEPDAAGPDDVALLLHTSGTTSRPKLVPLRHRNLCASARNVGAALALAPADRCLNVMPLFHIHGLVAACLASLGAGASVACTPGFYAPRFFGWLEELEPTWYTAVPTMHQAVLGRLPGNEELVARRPLRLVRSSSAALPPQVMAELERAFAAPVIESYGMTEAAHQMASNPLPPRERKPGSVGVAAGPEVAVLDEAGAVLAAGEVGEVAIRGENVFGGYEANPEANAAAFTNGWFRTGDQGYLDADGYLFLTGRIKELINRAGEKISPREVDEVLLDHPAVAQAVAFAVPDSALGEEVAAAVVPKDGARVTQEELQDFASERLADFKVPRVIVVVDEIPKGPTGKLQRIGLAETLGVAAPARGAGGARPPYAEPETELERGLATIAADVLAVDRVGRHDDLFDLGFDSMLAAQLLVRAHEDGLAPRVLPLTALLRAPTVERFAAVLASGEPVDDLCLVPIQPEGTRPPLFFVHPHDGRVAHFRHLARQLGPDQPFYALQSPAVEGAERPPTVEELARRYIEEIRAAQERGPYRIGGHCMGGAVALEMAQQLVAVGEDVALLALVNPAGEPRGTLGFKLRRSLQFARRAVRYARRGLLRKAIGYRIRVWVPAARARAAPEERRDLERVNRLEHARGDYEAKPYPGSVVLFRAEDYVTPTSFWQRIALGGLDCVEVEAGDRSILGPPAVDVVADRLRAALDEAREADEARA